MPRKRRLLILLDGTWNDSETSEDGTNISVMADLIARYVSTTSSSSESVILSEVEVADEYGNETNFQRVAGVDHFIFYQRGVGTGPIADKFGGGVFGWGVEKRIRQSYKFLCKYYIPGSQIFVFGFSRGAFTARSLIGYVGSAGLLRAENCDEHLEEEAWRLYRTSPADRFPAHPIRLKDHIHPPDEVRFACLSVFDTVGSLGIPSRLMFKTNREKYDFHEVLLSSIVRLNLQALAIDERRLPFGADIWRQPRFRFTNSVIEQTWFSGVHADVGGGYAIPNSYTGRTLNEIALDWMIKRLIFHYPTVGHFFKHFPKITELEEGQFPPQHESRTGFYRLAPAAVRSIGNTSPSLRRREICVSRDHINTRIGESVHISAIERLGQHVKVGNSKKIYAPPNLIAVLPELWERYCRRSSNSVSWSGALSIVDWSGEIIRESADEVVWGRVAKIIDLAVNSLKEKNVSTGIV